MSIRLIAQEVSSGSVEVELFGEENANWLAGEARKAGFTNAQAVKRHWTGESNVWHVLIPRNPDGTVEEIVSFLEKHPELEHAG